MVMANVGVDDEEMVKSPALGEIEGHERIEISGSLARHLEEVEEVEDAADVADSVPRGVMAGWRNKIRRGSSASGRYEARRGSEDTAVARRPSFFRSASQSSAMSQVSTIRSPTLSARIAANERGARLAPLDLSPEMMRTFSMPGDSESSQPGTMSSLGTSSHYGPHSSTPISDGSTFFTPTNRLRANSATSHLPTGRALLQATDELLPRPVTSASVAPRLHAHFAENDSSDDHRLVTSSEKGVERKASNANSTELTGTALGLSDVPTVATSFAATEQPLGLRLPLSAQEAGHLRRPSAISMSRGSSRGGTSVSGTAERPTVTMMRALQAEVLEEERRLTLRSKLKSVRRAHKGHERGESDGVESIQASGTDRKQ